MRELIGEDLTGARIRESDLTDVHIRDALLRRTKITGAWLEGVDISGEVVGQLLVNGVDVGPLVEAELDRRYPDRARMQPTDAAGYREAWPILERRWAELVERGRRLPEPVLHERVAEEWSFLETLRHLVFATDAWVSRTILGETDPFHPWGVPHTDVRPLGVTLDAAADPGLDEVLALRADRHATVRQVIAELTDEELDRVTDPNPAQGYPEDASHPVRRGLGAVVLEEWEHSTFAERDLAVLEARG